MAAPGSTQRLPRVLVHCARLAVFASTVALIHWQHRRSLSVPGRQAVATVQLDRVRPVYPQAGSVRATSENGSELEVRDAAGGRLGFLVQTSPASDHIIGFSGPTNVLLAFDAAGHVVGMDVLTSGDTRDHVRQVVQDDNFLKSWNGRTREQAAAGVRVDAVSGATLTCLAIQESIIHRLGGAAPSLRFPDPLTPVDVRSLFPQADSVQPAPSPGMPSIVRSGDGEALGTVLRSSPAADNIVGYQGPTEVLIGLDLDERVLGIALGKSYDNEPYVRYVREETYFLELFNGKRVDELAELDLVEAEVEGVSGATMTSVAVAESLVRAAAACESFRAQEASARSLPVSLSTRDMGTIAVLLAGLVLGLTPLRARRSLRLAFQVVLVVYLGLINGDMISQAMLVGWAQNGLPWRSSVGLVALTAAAFILPMTTKRNIYCNHLCPHGAAQQLLMNRLPWRLHLPRAVSPMLALVPLLLLVWCFLVAMLALPFSLVDIEPFDAWVFYIAGWATITIAIVGLVVSLFVPMAYCRFGCPTGALLNHLRYHARSDRWTGRDWLALGLAALGLAILLLPAG